MDPGALANASPASRRKSRSRVSPATAALAGFRDARLETFDLAGCRWQRNGWSSGLPSPEVDVGTVRLRSLPLVLQRCGAMVFLILSLDSSIVVPRAK